ncbi:hypothetical protein Nepgr_019672 [Nepenthes gracilis]|uniref:Tetraspanin-8 n=1 Tax=Nepenthes gracilis TaxID=150966 RepID=A0AAD3SVQ5_NEPGR|nr:hypothetical protein Nepgr_019672 [Nepenthes gracilis]
MRLSNNLVGILNFLTFVLSIPILAGGIWLAHKANTTVCEKFFEKPIIVLGVFLMVVSLLGFIGACFRVNWLLWLYLLVMFLLIVLLFCFTIFAFVVTNKGAGKALEGKGYKEYRLGDYSHWLQKRVNSTKNWKKIKSCLIDGKVCQSLTKENTTTLSQFYAKNLSPIQSGCCKPSDDCGFQYVSPTNWTNPSGTTTFNDSDCSLWSNDQSTLCFNCQSCKAGVLQNVKSDWKKVAIINIICLVFLVIVYSVGCCAFRNNREDNYRWKPYG